MNPPTATDYLIVGAAAVLAAFVALLASPFWGWWFDRKIRREQARTVRSEMEGLDDELKELLNG